MEDFDRLTFGWATPSVRPPDRPPATQGYDSRYYYYLAPATVTAGDAELWLDPPHYEVSNFFPRVLDMKNGLSEWMTSNLYAD